MPAPQRSFNPAEEAAKLARNMSVDELRAFIAELAFGLRVRSMKSPNVWEARDLLDLYRQLDYALNDHSVS
jgi:hypothetical protein